MRLLIATPLYPPEIGGPATYTRLLEEGLSVPVTVIKFSDVSHYSKGVRHFVYFWKVYQASRDTDVILALDPVSVGLPALWAAKLRGIPFLVKIVGDYAWEQGTQRFGITDSLDVFVRRAHVPFRVRALRAIQTHVARSANKILVPSEYLKGIVHAWGINREKIQVIYNAIELEEGGNIPQSLTDLPHPHIVTAARLVPWKGIHEVIDAVAALAEATSLVIVGDGPERELLTAHAQNKLGTRALFLGTLSHADTLAVIKEADVFVLNSTYEGLSHVLIEALMLGTPTVATRAGGNGELIRHEENGLLVDVHDTEALAAALHRLRSDTNLRARFAAEADDAQKRFSVSAMYVKTEEALRNL